MKHLSRIISFLLVAVMCFTLAACGGQSSGTGEQTQATTASVTTTAATTAEDPLAKFAPVEGKKYKITWAFPVIGNANIEPDGSMVKYWEEMFNVDIDVFNYADRNTLNIKIASGEIPDVFRVETNEDYLKFAEEGITGELSDQLLEKYMPNLWNGLEKEFPGYWKDNCIDGKRYGLANLNPNSPYRYPIVWRGDWLKNVGIDKIPSTLQEYETALYKFAKEDPDKNGKNDTYGLSVSALQIIYAAYGYIPAFKSTSATKQGFWAEKDGKLVYGGIQPELKEAITLLNKWYKDGVLDPEFITGENTGGYWAITHAFTKGRIGLTSHGYFYHWIPAGVYSAEHQGAANVLEMFNTLGSELSKGIAFGEPPVGVGGKQMMGACGDKYWGVFNSISAKVFESEPDKVGIVLKIWDYINGTDFDTFFLASNGQKGIDYDYKDGVLVSLSEDIAHKVKIGANTAFHTQPLLSLLKQNDPVMWKWGDETNFGKAVVQNGLQWPLPAAVKYKAELMKIEEEAYIAMITGQKPVSYFDEYVSTWLAAGGEELTKEANDWYAGQK